MWIFQPVIATTLTEVPYPGLWNGSLWTLSFEGMAYVIAGVVFGAALARRHPAQPDSCCCPPRSGPWALVAAFGCVLGAFAGQSDVVTPLPLA